MWFVNYEDLPLPKIQIISFNLDQAKRTGEFAKIIFAENKSAKEKLSPRAIIPNDAKLFSQVDLDKTITHFVTSDIRSQKTLTYLKKETKPRFNIINISTPYSLYFELLDLQ